MTVTDVVSDAPLPFRGPGEVSLAGHRCARFNDAKDTLNRTAMWASLHPELQCLHSAMLREMEAKMRIEAIRLNVITAKTAGKEKGECADCIPATSKPQKQSKRLGI